MKTFTTWMLTGILLCQISACSTPEQRQAQELKRQAVQRGAEANRQASLEARCRGYGFELRTAGFAQCMMKLDQADQQTAFQNMQREDLEYRCGLVQAQALLTPGNSIQAGVDAGNACMAGMPPPVTRVICQRQGSNDVYCFSQ
jgi:hypothetical protein